MPALVAVSLGGIAGIIAAVAFFLACVFLCYVLLNAARVLESTKQMIDGVKEETVPLLGSDTTDLDKMIRDQVAKHGTKIARPQNISQLENQGVLEQKVFKLLSGQAK